MPGIFLNVREVQLIEGHATYTGAFKSYSTIRDAIGKKPGQKILIPEYCQHEGVPIELVTKLLKLQKSIQLALFS